MEKGKENLKKKKEWHIVYYSDLKDNSEVMDYIKSLEVEERKKVLGWIFQLKIQGPTLPRPYADTLREGIHELRVQISGEKIRILYFFCYKNFIILTNNFVKNTNKVPEKEIKKAIKLREDFLERYNEEKLYKEFIKSV